jgi:hypothetical protein
MISCEDNDNKGLNFISEIVVYVCVRSTVYFQHIRIINNTVKPVLRGHPWDQEKVAS